MPKISKKEEFRKMLIASLLKDAKKKKVTECTNSCKPKKTVSKKAVSKKAVSKKKVVSKKAVSKKSKKVMVGGDDFQSEPFVPYKGTKKVEFNTKVLNASSKRMYGGDNFVKDLQRAGKGVGLSIEHTFTSISNLAKSIQCEVQSVENIGRELDVGYTKDCPYIRSKHWDYNKIKQ
jgi:hypothetical protein